MRMRLRSVLFPPYGVLYLINLQGAAVSCGFHGGWKFPQSTEYRLFPVKVLVSGILKQCYGFCFRCLRADFLEWNYLLAGEGIVCRAFIWSCNHFAKICLVWQGSLHTF